MKTLYRYDIPWLPSGVAGTAYFNHMFTGYFMSLLNQFNLHLNSGQGLNPEVSKFMDVFGIHLTVESVVKKSEMKVGEIYNTDLLAYSLMKVEEDPQILYPVFSRDRMLKSMVFDKNLSDSHFVRSYVSYLKSRQLYVMGGVIHLDLAEVLFNHIVYVGNTLKLLYNKLEGKDFETLYTSISKSGVDPISVAAELSNILPSSLEEIWKHNMGNQKMCDYFKQYPEFIVKGMESMYNLIHRNVGLSWIFNAEGWIQEFLKRKSKNIQDMEETATLIKLKDPSGDFMFQGHLIAPFVVDSVLMIPFYDNSTEIPENLNVTEVDRYVRFIIEKDMKRFKDYKATLPNMMHYIFRRCDTLLYHISQQDKFAIYTSAVKELFLKIARNDRMLSAIAAYYNATGGHNRRDISFFRKKIVEYDYSVNGYHTTSGLTLTIPHPFKKYFSSDYFTAWLGENGPLEEFMKNILIKDLDVEYVKLDGSQAVAKFSNILLYATTYIQRLYSQVAFDVIMNDIKVKFKTFKPIGSIEMLNAVIKPIDVFLSEFPEDLKPYFRNPVDFERLTSAVYLYKIPLLKNLVTNVDETYGPLMEYNFDLQPFKDSINRTPELFQTLMRYYNQSALEVWISWNSRPTQLAGSVLATVHRNVYFVILALLGTGGSVTQLLGWKLMHLCMLRDEDEPLDDGTKLVEPVRTRIRNVIDFIVDKFNFKTLCEIGQQIHNLYAVHVLIERAPINNAGSHELRGRAMLSKRQYRKKIIQDNYFYKKKMSDKVFNVVKDSDPTDTPSIGSSVHLNLNDKQWWLGSPEDSSVVFEDNNENTNIMDKAFIEFSELRDKLVGDFMEVQQIGLVSNELNTNGDSDSRVVVKKKRSKRGKDI